MSHSISAGPKLICRRSALVNALLLGLWVGFECVPTRAQFDELLAKIPASANAVALLDAQRLFTSPIGVREGWKDKYEQSFAAGLVTMSPDTQRLVLGAEFDYEFMKPKWEAAVADFGKPRSAVDIAHAAKGTLEKIGDTSVVALRENAYVVELGKQQFGAMTPANRQAVARWLRQFQGHSEATVSPYLKGTLAASQTSAVVIAFDLEDAIPPDIVLAKLNESQAIKAAKVDVTAAAKALDSIRGLVIEVAVTDGSYGRLMVHFGGDVSVLAPVAKPLLQEVLADLGAAISDIDGWNVQSQPQRIGMNGPLGNAGRKRIFSLIDSPLASLLASDETAPTAEDRQRDKTIAASQQYFKAITSLITEVREKSGDAKTFGENALWFDKWARRIEKLSVLNVDRDLLTYGQFVSETLRNMAGALRGVTISTNANQMQVTGGGYNYDGYSYYAGWRDVDAQRRAIRTQGRATGATAARGMARQIESATAKTRQDLTQKYQVEF